MRRQTLNFVIDALAILAFLTLVATGALLRFVLPPRSGALGLSGWNRHDWGDFHFQLSLVLVGLVAVHVALHWRWVYETVRGWLRPRKGERSPLRARTLVLSGTAFVLLIAGLFAAAFWLGQTNLETRGGGLGQGHRGGRGAGLVSADSTGASEADGMQSGQRREQINGQGRRHGRLE
jgi:hypothetical protein